jgi:hypothetical protein
VWVVCSESHYSVLFSPERSVLGGAAAQSVDLFYYDELAMQDEEIRLTLDNDPRPLLSECEIGSCDKKGVGGSTKCKCIQPPLDWVIRTKWKTARVDWNGTEALL